MTEIHNNLIRIYRYILTYGILRTLIKVAGRKRSLLIRGVFPKIFINKNKRYISLIGCGQFGFSTISYFLLLRQGNRFLDCYDIDKERQKSTSKFWGYKEQDDIENILTNEKLQIVYIASNHFSHTPYSIPFISKNIDVYIEKPIAVNWEQLSSLLRAIKYSNSVVYTGYNRPFSKAITILDKKIEEKREAISLACFVSGHLLPADHWYRLPEEGTRVCGNIGHWIDLAVHLMKTRGRIPEKFIISISYSDVKDFDDNISITITTNLRDLINIILTARSEPLEGVNETINFQCGNLIAKIDDFEKMSIWEGAKFSRYRFWPKDVGHKEAINQPYIKRKRDFEEVKISTILILTISDMVRKQEELKEILPFVILSQIESNENAYIIPM